MVPTTFVSESVSQATLLASPLELDALVIDSVYPTITEAIHNRIAMRVGVLSRVLTPMLLWQLPFRAGISLRDLRPIDQIPNVGCPLLISCGDHDQHTTLAETRRMFAAAKEPKQLVIFPSAAHVDLLEFDSERYRREILAFLEEHLHGL